MTRKTLKDDNISDEKVIFLFEKMVKKWRRDSLHKDDHTKLGKKLFEAIARLSISISFEAVFLRENKKTKQLEVFLTERGKNESFPGEWHCPGSIFRPGEMPADVANRLSKNEFHNVIKSNFVFVKDYLVQEVRGWFLTRVYLVELKGEPKTNGKWFPINKLPKHTIRMHRMRIIPAAVDFYLEKYGRIAKK